MKKNHLFQCRLWYFVLPMLLLDSIPVHSQGTILSSNQCSEFSIIRNYESNVDITYNVMLDTITFNYVDRNTMTTLSVNIQNQFLVWDFLVFHDSVFFCGESNQTAVFGYFDIQDVFFSSGNINYYTLPTDYNIVSLKRIDVTKALSGATHLLMTGLGYLYFANNNVSDKEIIDSTDDDRSFYYLGAVVEAWRPIPSVTNTKMRYTLIDTHYTYLYDDVAFTDNYAIITAHTADSTTTHNLFYYKSPISPSNGYLDSWISTPPLSNTPIQKTDLSIIQLGSNIKITIMQKDSFATACKNLLDSNITISIYKNPTQQSVKRFAIPGTYICQEIVYNTLQKALYLLDSNLYHIRHPFVTSLKLEETSYNRWLSLDNTDHETQVILSGWDPSMMIVYPKMYWLFDINNINSCYNNYFIPNKNINQTDQPNYYSQIILYDELVSRPLSPTRKKFTLNIVCP